MKTTAIFVIILALSHMIAAQKAFDTVKNLLTNFKNDILNEQTAADNRDRVDTATCEKKIQDAQDVVNARQLDVDNLTAHIAWLNNEKSESEKDKAEREARLVSNRELLAKFKQQRCDNNLIFVKELRERMEAVDVLNLLKVDIDNYFTQKAAQPTPAFIERFQEFSHLLSDKNRQIFISLTQEIQSLPNVNELTARTDASTATQQRTNEEVGVQHVDNNRGELQKMEHQAWEKTDVYYAKLHKRVMEMIEALIQHINDSKAEIIKNEIKAAEDFAVFQSNMEKENQSLIKRIDELTAHIADLTNQINVATTQLEKRQKLLEEAQAILATEKRICAEKKTYYVNENTRRSGEITIVDNATQIFVNLMTTAQRVRERASQDASAEEVTGDLSQNVVKSEPTLSNASEQRINERNAVAY